MKKFATITLSIAMLAGTAALPLAAFADDGGFDGGGYDGGFSGGGYDGGFSGGSSDGFSGGSYSPGFSYVPDYTASYAPDYSGSYAPDYSGSYAPDYSSSYAPDYTSSYAPDYTDTYGTTVTDEYGVDYSYTPSFSAPTSFGGGSSYSIPSYSYPSTPMSFNAPTYRAPTYYPPTYVPPTPAPRPTPAPVTTPTTITNVNNNTNNNNNNININNNSNAVAIATVAPIAAAPIQYQAQYVQPTYYAPQPSCTITITNYNGSNYGPYGNNQLATLTWSSQNANNGFISPNVGSVSGYGSMQVYPVNGQTYSMTVYGQGGSATCVTQPFYTYVAPIVNNPTPYVSLSQIPYTGFDFGTLGNSIYWLSLMVFAGAAAYLVLYFNGGALALVGMKRNKSAQIAMPTISVTRAPAQAVAAKKEELVVSPIQLATSSRTSTADTMHVKHSKTGEAPRIYISRE